MEGWRRERGGGGREGRRGEVEGRGEVEEGREGGVRWRMEGGRE